MKKLLVAAFALISISASAQKGSVLLYGNLTGRSSNDAGGTQSATIVVNPGVGYQFSDHFTAGINLSVDADKTETTPSSDNYNKNLYLNFGPFLRYTKTLNNLFSAYAQLNLNYLSQKYTPYTGSSTKYAGFNGNITPALSLNVHKGFAINFNLGGIEYTSVGLKGSSAKNNSFNVTFGNTIGLGIQKTFACKKSK
ncbi:outer membrane beta-barrel protein [Ferruginibacter sp. SUN002]|uniref:outer membrane beta-barrel protein n=1 Tax=Ferruginibacter sp. SUN002 TaxID=2937789 RepID=UPI003D35AAD6